MVVGNQRVTHVLTASATKERVPSLCKGGDQVNDGQNGRPELNKATHYSLHYSSAFGADSATCSIYDISN